MRHDISLGVSSFAESIPIQSDQNDENQFHGYYEYAWIGEANKGTLLARIDE